ncbi:MAG: hypothetical protein LLG04_10120, partial [Parachlamydia sp.]|nr:hypothetical protein [Parachlamydia sp.]
MTQPVLGSGKQTDPVTHQHSHIQQHTNQQASTATSTIVSPVEKPGMLARLWNGVKGAASQGVSHAGHFATVRIVSNLDKNKEQVEAELNRLRGKLEKSTGTPDIANLIGRQSRDNFPRLLDLFRGEVRNQWLRETLEYTLISSPNLLQNCMEATLLKMMDNLVERVKADAAANGHPLAEPIPPKELIERIMALGSAVGSEELDGLKKLQDLEGSEHEIPGFYEISPDYEGRSISEKMADKLLNVALPNGSSDLILPPGIAGSILSWAGYELLGSYLLPEMISKLNEKTTNINQYHVGFIGYLKEVSSDGEAVTTAIHPLIAKFAEWLQTKAKESGDTISDPLLRGLVGPFLKESDHSSEMRLLLQKTDTFFYPLAIHILGNLAIHAEESGERNKPLLTMVSHVVLKDLLEFANQNKREDLGKAIAAYEKDVQQIQTSAEQEIKAIEKQSGEAIAAIVVSRTAERDRVMAEVKTEKEIKAIQKKYSDLIAAETAPLKVAGDNRKADVKKQMEQKLLVTKSPFSPLIARLMQKMGADEEGVANILPFFQKGASEKMGEMLNDICIDYFKSAVVQEGQPPAAAARMVGQKEARTLIQDIVKKAIPTLKKGFTEASDVSPLRELMASADMDVIQSYAEPYIANLVSDLLVHLADSNPLTKDQEQVDMVSSAIQNLTRLASEKLENSRFRTQVAELVNLPEGPAKEAKKNLLLAPVAEEIVKRAGWGDEANIRLPKLLRGKAKEMLEKDILPDLIYRGVQLWSETQKTHLENEIALQQQTTDGDALTKVVKTLADNTGAIVADIAHKAGVAIETSVARPKEAGLEYLIRDEIVSAIHKYPFLAQLKDPVLQNSLVQILKEMQPTLLKETDKLSYPLLIHVLAKLTEGEPKQSTAGAGVNRLLQTIFSFAEEDREKLSGAWSEHQKRLDAVELEFPDANTPETIRAKAEKLKEARKPFKACFQPLIDDVVQKAGLDPEGLSKVLPVGAKPLSELIKSEALDFCVDFYEEVIATQGSAPDIAKDMPGYLEGRNLFQGMMVELMPAIREALAKKENQSDIQTALADEINDRLFHGKLPLDKDWIMQPVAELVSETSPHFQQLRGFVEPYLVDTVTGLFALLAASFKGPAEGDMAAGDMAKRAIAHLTVIMMNEVKDPELAKKLADWKALPEKSEEEKRAKSKKKTRLREEIFGACSEKVLEAAGWNDPKNIRAPKVLRPVVKRLMEKTVLPDQLFRIAADMLVPQAFSLSEHRSLEEMGGTNQLRKIADGFAEKLTPTIFSKTREYADLIAAKCNEKLTLNALSVHDEASLANNIDRLLDEKNEELKPAWKFTEGLLSRTLQDGLSRLALNYDGPNQGDLAANIALYLRKKLKDFSFPAGIGEKIRDYSKHTAPLKAL